MSERLEPPRQSSLAPACHTADSLLAPGIRDVVRAIREAGAAGPDITTLPLTEARERYAEQQRRWLPRMPTGVAVRRFVIPEADTGDVGSTALSAVSVQAAFGLDDPRRPPLLYLHGGGWVLGSIDTHLAAMAHLALRADVEVIGIDYRLSPEAAYPLALQDTLRAWRWMAASERAATGPCYLAGDSAGANLAVALMLVLRDLNGHGREELILPMAALLFYGVYAPDENSRSHRRFGSGHFGLSSARMAWFRQHYLAGADGAAAASHALVSPLRANLGGLPPLLVMSAQCDPLCDDSSALARRAKAAGVEVTLSERSGLIHGFLQMADAVPEAMAALDDAAAYLRARVTGAKAG
ncbi:MAG: alpha/beta hydrolase [Pseudomonadota bacterium]